MDNQVFETYFSKTRWQEGMHTPSEAELVRMENDCTEKLIELSKKRDKSLYDFFFNKYGNDLISRIGFFKKKLLFEEDKNIEILLLSAQRFRKNLKALDRTRYEKYLRTGIERGKGGITWANVMMEMTKDSKGKVKSTERLFDNPQPNKVLEKKGVEVRHFKSLRLKDEEAPILYDKLVEGGYLEDTGKDDFVYYFTGKGKQAQKKLKWRGDEHPYVILSVLLEQLCPPKKIDWETAYSVFEKLPSAMKITLKKTYDRYKDECKQYNNNPQKIKSAYKKHLKLVKSWLTPAE